MHESTSADAQSAPGAGPSLFNIAQYLPAMAAAAPDRAAILCPHAPDSRGRRALNFRELNADSDRLAWGLRDVGVVSGARTLLMVRPGLDFVALTFALFKLGAVPVLIDPGMGMKNLLNCVRQSRPAAMIAVPLAHAARVTLGDDAFDSVALHVTVGRRWFWGGLTLSHIRMLGSDRTFPIAETIADSPAAVLFTSGGTGAPKGVLYEHGMFGAQVKLIRDVYRIEPGEIDLPAFPLFGLFGAALGTTSVIPDMDPSHPARCDPAKLVAALQSQRVTYTFGSPAIWKRVAPWCLERNITLPLVKRVLMAGAPVRAEVLEPFARILTNGDTYIPYGATEALPVASIRGSEVLSDTWELTRRGKGYCVGRPLPGITVRIVNAAVEFVAPQAWDDALVLPPNSIGEIVVKGPVVTHEYFELPKQTALAKMYERVARRKSGAGAGAGRDSTKQAGGGARDVGAASASVPTPPTPPFQGGEKGEARFAGVSDVERSLSVQAYDVWHRMGDMGYFDPEGRLWFCGRKAHRVLLRNGRVLYSVCIEAVFENFLTPRMTGASIPSVRAALAGIGAERKKEGVIVVELPRGKSARDVAKLNSELDAWSDAEALTADVAGLLWYADPFPVDVRHNAKIDRERLSRWAQEQPALHWENPRRARIQS